MYKDFYSFSEEPFALSPDPKFLYLARSHWEALSSLMSGIKERKGIVVITGEVGVGKTILVYALLKDLSEKIKTAFIFNPKLDFKDLLKNILRDLEVPLKEKEEDLLSLMHQLEEYLQERLSKDETVAIIIDEAQSVDEKVLEELGRLPSLDTPAAKLLQIVLMGQPELEVKLNSEELRPFKKRIAIHGQIRPLTREEGRGYMRHRLKLVGRSISEVFTSEAVNRVWEFAEGIPRVMNLLCDRALLIGYSDSSPIIDSKIVDGAIKDYESLRPPKSGILRPALAYVKSRYKLIGLLLLLFLALSLVVFSLLHRAPSPPPLKVTGKILPSEERPLEKREEKREGKQEGKKEGEIVEVQKGWTLFLVARQYYPALNPSLLDFILEANPQIIDPNLIFPHQQIIIPNITEESLLLRVSDTIYHIRLGTFKSNKEVRLYKDEPALRGKNLRVIPRKFSPGETWYRVLVEEFHTPEEALRTIQVLKEKRLLPLLDCLPRKPL